MCLILCLCVVVLTKHIYHRGSHFLKMMEFLSELKRGECEGVKVRLDRLQVFMSTSCIEHLDHIFDDTDDSRDHSVRLGRWQFFFCKKLSPEHQNRSGRSGKTSILRIIWCSSYVVAYIASVMHNSLTQPTIKTLCNNFSVTRPVQVYVI